MQALHSMQQTHQSDNTVHGTTVTTASNLVQHESDCAFGGKPEQDRHSQLRNQQQQHHHELEMTKLDQAQQQQQQANQPVLSVLNPVAQHQAPPIIHHLGQQQQQPLLHQLQTPSQTGDLLQLAASEDQQSINQSAQDQQQQQSVAPSNGSNRHQHQRSAPAMVEGIVADAGGPIVQWLLDNYEIAEGESLPRSTVYNHYLAHCRQLQMSSVNAASFGKLIRSVFVGLKTRRLGTRGHSKYHYFGVRAKQHVRLDWIERELESEHEHQSRHQHHHNHPHHHHLHETGSNGQPDIQMGDNGSESDSMECASSCGGGGGGNGSGGSGSSKRFKRHMFGCHDRQRGVSTVGSNQMMGRQQQHYETAQVNAQQPQATGCIQQCAGPIGCQHAQAAVGPVALEHDATLIHSMYANGYGQPYYQPTAMGGLYCGGGAAAAASTGADDPHNSHNEAELQQQQHLHGGVNWSTATSDCDEVLHVTTGEDLSHFRNYLGQGAANLIDDVWPIEDHDKSLDDNQLKEFELFEQRYKEHYRRLVAHVGELNFSSVENCLKSFWLANNQNAVPAMATNHWQATTTTTTTTATKTTTSDIHESDQSQSHNQSSQNGDSASDCLPSMDTNQLKRLTGLPSNVSRIIRIDQLIYSGLVSVLMPNLCNIIPRPLTQHLRAFARYFPSWLENCLKDYPSQFSSEASKTARHFGHTLRRHVSINHLASAARAIWSRRSALTQMSIDLGRVDLRDIEHQLSLMVQRQQQQQQQAATMLIPTSAQLDACPPSNHHIQQQQQRLDSQTIAADYNDQPSQAHHNETNNENFMNQMHSRTQDHDVIPARGRARLDQQQSASLPLQPAQLVQSFLNLLDDPDPVTAWPNWCRQLVDSRVGGQSLDEARNFVLRWNFYVSLIMKELTLKSAPSLGSYQLIRLLFDEYIYYLTLLKVSQDQDNKQTSQLLRPSARFVENV